MKTLLIYGATGYTGRMIAKQAKDAGLNLVIAGRNKEKLDELAKTLDVRAHAFALDDAEALPRHLDGITVVLNCAGPFAHTSESLMRACIIQGVHYLDITAEINVYRLAESLHDLASTARVMLLPGVGWDVVPTDCLAVTIAEKVHEPVRLRIALQVAGAMSRGSALSVGEIISAGLLARVNGELTTKTDAKTDFFDFGEGKVECAPLSFGDLVTAWHSTGIPNIEMYVHVSGDAFPSGDLSRLPDGPSQEERAGNVARAVVEMTGVDGDIHHAVIETVNGYSYTPLAAVEAARRVLSGTSQPGFQTPAKVFGADFALSIQGTRISTL
ncbi:saccharopine dehydrogenase family protein [Yersinia intermedia]|uniref:saccharopine dehydrogenase family protein n=1 Tax=Yersinia intermedia TaxID=631 RepID=UPI001CFF0804|nr:saccharopine dehydrogenase NADP-binding domain-containing protein [Yersinia intermedia]MCB5313651.1 saccharopine dehydrogenase NADP-binding domain-containing protein [Yersinia intermedia]MCB5327610.1 saccharopine dehydrogenase NADP-binding domain-containing protein [Yersinia intermedia]